MKSRETKEQNYIPKLSEKDVKSSVVDYLDILMSQHRLWYDRLNSGEILALNKDGSQRLVKLCREGTSDYLIIIHGITIFCELKSSTGKQKDSQKEFEVLVVEQGAQYWLVNSFEQFKKLVDKYLE